MLVNSNSLLERAYKDGYAIPAYNINNLEWAKYILEMCEEDKSPVILGVSLSAVKYFGGYNVVVNVIKGLIKDLDITIPVVLHLDHADSIEACKCAIKAGFTSVMVDFSKLDYEENLNKTIEVVNYAESLDVSVEAELGVIDNDNYEICDIENCKNYVLSTGINSFAPAIGNRHGIYTKEANLNFDLLGQICKETRVPLVLHGASGLNDNMIKTAIFCGVSKININTDLQIAWSNAVRNFLDYNKDVIDPRLIFGSGEKALKNMIHKKNILFGSVNKFN